MELEDARTGVSGGVVAAVILIIILAAGATGGMYYYLHTKSTSSSQQSPSGFQTSTTTAKPFSLFGGPSYNLEVTSVTVAQSAQVDGYILDVDASYSGGGTWTVNPSDFELVSGTSTVFTLLPGNFIEGMTTPLTEVVLANGQQAQGQLAFQLPSGQAPAKLEYLNQSANIDVSSSGIPQTDSYVCPEPSMNVGASSSSVFGSGAQVQPGGYASEYYISGSEITIPVIATWDSSGGPTQPGAAVIAVATNSSEIELVRTQPTLPLSIEPGGLLGSSASLNVTVSTPSSGCIAKIGLDVTISKTQPSLTVSDVSFPAEGTSGLISVSNAGSSVAYVTEFSLSYAGGSCDIEISTNDGGGAVNPNSSYDLTWLYSGGTPCGGTIDGGEQFSGSVTFSDGAVIPFSGIFQSAPVGSGAQVAVTAVNLVGATELAGTGAVSCSTNTGAAANSIVLTNTGNAAASPTSVSITFGGAVYTYSVGGECVVAPAGETGALAEGNPLAITLGGIVIAGATSGASFTGTVMLSDGAILIFAGTFL